MLLKKKPSVPRPKPVVPIPSDPEDRRAEYLDAGEQMRAYGNLRFAQLTLFVAISAGILSVLITKDTSAPRMTLKIGGVIVTVIFYILEERSTGFWVHYKERAKELENVMQCAQYTREVKHYIPIPATWATRALFIAAASFWIISLFRTIPEQHTITSLPRDDPRD